MLIFKLDGYYFPILDKGMINSFIPAAKYAALRGYLKMVVTRHTLVNYPRHEQRKTIMKSIHNPEGF
jgi:hypothetical protein